MAHSKFVLCLLTAAAVFSGVAAHAEASYSETVRLVRSMRDDEQLLEGLQTRLGERADATDSPGLAVCLSQVKYPYLTDAIALVISSQLTDAEVAEGIEFYRSPLGRKYAEYSVRQSIEKLPLITANLSEDEQRALASFAKRPVGRKLLLDRITEQQEVASKALMRMQIAFEDCLSASAGEGEQFPRVCASVPVVSPENNCSVEQMFYMRNQPASSTITSIEVHCLAVGEHLLSYDGPVERLALKWADAYTVEIAASSEARLTREPGPRRFNIRRKEFSATDTAQICHPRPLRNSAGFVPLDEVQSQPFWMSYGDEQRCVLSKRLDRGHVRGAADDGLAQFLQVKRAQYPFGTSQLVFFESFSKHTHVRSARVLGVGGSEVELSPGGPKAGFHAIGAPAQEILKALAGGSVLTLELQPAKGDAVTIPLGAEDLDWAHPSFESCLRTL